MKQEFHILIDAQTPAEDKVASIMAQHTDLSKQAIKQAMKKGALWIEDDKGVRRLRRADTIPPRGSTLHLYYDTDILDTTPPQPTLIADEHGYSIWCKPAGMLSQGSKWGDHCTINRWIESNTPFDTKPERNCFVVHRLDRAACGLMIIAHKKSIAAQLSALFEKRDITKRYRVIVEGAFPQEEQIIESDIEGKKAFSAAKRIAFCPRQNRSLLDVDIKTGRKHQIRIHLSRLGYPVAGDRLHGIADQPAADQEDLQLCAFSLHFICPITSQDKQYELPAERALAL